MTISQGGMTFPIFLQMNISQCGSLAWHDLLEQITSINVWTGPVCLSVCLSWYN